jgi:hypothetical protein
MLKIGLCRRLTAYLARACVQIAIGCSKPLIVCGG